MINPIIDGLEPVILADYECHVCEGPLWHPDEGRLYWLDIPQGRMFRLDPKTGKHEQVYEGRPVGGITIQKDGSLLLFMDRGSVAIWREGRELEFVIDQIDEEVDSRFNDVIADPEGRVFCGTMSSESHPGKLYRLDPDRSIQVVIPETGTANGMGFSTDLSRMYFTDTGPRQIYVFDYNRKTGSISNQRNFSDPPPEQDGKPDGMTIDSDDYIWSARWDGSILVRLSPDGVEERRITFPAKKISCLTFGGDDLTDIFVTAAGGQDKKTNGPGAGALFHFNLGIPGKPEYRSNISL
ncbi:MAG: SMP-30/gluconolactonase/LRE family protein [Spirochaetales bacterium]|jgi:D-xylono/L-arabinono-1,4-lactonase|nr:SMP-30/gluconolactonase/LRE family protein [Spirochaetales bacterium]